MKTPDVKRVLVVEDEPVISNLCKRALVSEGFEVDIVINGRIAQGMIEEKQYDFCLIDIKTPAMNGKELYQWIEGKHPELANGVLFTTGDVMEEETKGFLERAARPFLLKPFTRDEIKAIIRKASKEVG